MRSLIRTSILLLLLLSIMQVVGQHPVYRHYTIREGLPSSEIYHVYQDSKRYIWLATNMGVSRFDGKEFKNYDVQDGLPENTVFEIYEDIEGKVWFIGYPFQLAYFSNDSIHKYKYNDILRRIAGKGNVPIKRAFSVDKDGKGIIFSIMRGQAVYSINASGTISRITDPIDLKGGINIIERDSCFYYYQSGENTDEEIGISIITNDIKMNTFIKRSKNYSHGNMFVARSKSGELFVSSTEFIVKMWPDGRQFSKAIYSRVIWMGFDEYGDLWIGTEQNGVMVFKDGDIESDPVNRYLPGLSVSSIITDKEGGKWFTTFEDGVYYLASQSFLSIQKADGLSNDRVNCINMVGDKVIFGTNDNHLNILSNGSIQQIRIFSNTQRGINRIEKDKNNNLWIGTQEYLYFYDWKKVTRYVNNHDYFSLVHVNNRKNFNLKDIYPDENGVVYLGEGNGISILEGTRVSYNSYLDDDIELRVETIKKVRDSVFLLGTHDGAWLFNRRKFEYLGLLNPLLKYRITDIKLIDKDDSFVAGTKGYGLVVNSKEQSYHLTMADGLSANSVSSLLITGNLLWVGTNNGLNLLELDKIGTNDLKIWSFNKQHGLISNEINYLAGNEDVIYIATSEGVTIFNYKEYKPIKVPPPVYINALSVMGEDATVKSGYAFKYNQNFITIKFSGLSFLDSEKLSFRCRLSGLSDEWINTDHSQIDYAFLPPGKYTFEVLSINSEGLESEAPATITFIIRTPYWKTWWFMMIIVLILGGLVTLMYLYRMKQVKKENTLRNDIIWYRQQALSKQMDPHFVFNTLNSIQSYIINNDRLLSSQYLAKFAKLMRLILNNSQKHAVPLSDEVSALKIYLELESLRFQQKFQYDLNIEPEVDPEKNFIPAFMIQPFVENSIWHGIMGIDRVGHIHVGLKMSADGDHILCTIEDNGKGRKQSMEEKTDYEKSRKSMGVSLISTRLKLLNTLYGTDMKVEYTDLYDNGEARGTRVEISLPIIS